jgi:hypothetical protein
MSDIERMGIRVAVEGTAVPHSKAAEATWAATSGKPFPKVWSRKSE